MNQVSGVFLKVATLKKWDRFRKFQDIDSSDFVTTGFGRWRTKGNMPGLGSFSQGTNILYGGVVHFISHRWHSTSHPDPSGEQLEWIKQEFPDDALIWYDYCCLPQEPRTPTQEQAFRRGIDAIPSLIQQSWFVVSATGADAYSQRAWCQFEAVIALNSGSHPPFQYIGGLERERKFAAQTTSLLRQSPLYKTFQDSYKSLPKDTESARKEQEQDERYSMTGYYLSGYYLDVPDLNDPAFAGFRSLFFQLHASVLADPPVLWEILRKVFPAHRENRTYLGY